MRPVRRRRRTGERWRRRTEAALAERAGVTRERVRRLGACGILEPRAGPRPFASADVRKVRLAEACEAAGLPLEAIGTAVRQGRLSFAFLDLPTYEILADHTGESFGELAAARGLPLPLVAATREALGFARPLPGEPVREDDLRVVALVELAVRAGLPDAVVLQLLRVYGDNLARIAEAESAVYRSRFVQPLRDAGEGEGRSMERASAMAGALIPALEDMTVAVYHRQQEHAWLQNLVESIETVLEEEGLHERMLRPPAMCFVDLTGYTRLTEEYGDEAAAAAAARLADVVQRSAVRHGGRPVKRLGDGVMVYFPDAHGSAGAALAMVDATRTAGLPPAHVGLAAGPIVHQDGDYFGRTVNLAARIAGAANPSEVLVSAAVVDAAGGEDVTFTAAGDVTLKGFADPVPLFRAHPAEHSP